MLISKSNVHVNSSKKWMGNGGFTAVGEGDTFLKPSSKIEVSGLYLIPSRWEEVQEINTAIHLTLSYVGV